MILSQEEEPTQDMENKAKQEEAKITKIYFAAIVTENIYNENQYSKCFKHRIR